MSFLKVFKVSPLQVKIRVFSLFVPRKTQKVQKSVKKSIFQETCRFFGNRLKSCNIDPILPTWLGDPVPSPYQGETNPLICRHCYLSDAKISTSNFFDDRADFDFILI